MNLNWDKIGIGLSSICVVHCVLTPVAFAVLPLMGFATGEHTHIFHWLMGAFLLPVAMIAFVRGYKHHHQLIPGFFGLFGVTIVFGALFFVNHETALYQHFAVSIVGSLFLLLGHTLNRRACNECKDHNHTEHEHTHAQVCEHHSHSHDHTAGHGDVHENSVQTKHRFVRPQAK